MLYSFLQEEEEEGGHQVSQRGAGGERGREKPKGGNLLLALRERSTESQERIKEL